LPFEGVWGIILRFASTLLGRRLHGALFIEKEVISVRIGLLDSRLAEQSIKVHIELIVVDENDT